jgi:hypothetical protein
VGQEGERSREVKVEGKVLAYAGGLMLMIRENECANEKCIWSGGHKVHHTGILILRCL